ncbi:hypothetical protein [Snodgrassella alvi]
MPEELTDEPGNVHISYRANRYRRLPIERYN